MQDNACYMIVYVHTMVNCNIQMYPTMGELL